MSKSFIIQSNWKFFKLGILSILLYILFKKSKVISFSFPLINSKDFKDLNSLEYLSLKIGIASFILFICLNKFILNFSKYSYEQ